jgi:predicted RNA methylase
VSALRHLGRSLIDAREWLFDFRHSVETRAGVVNPQVNAAYAESAAHGTRYEAVRLYILHRLMAECRRSGELPQTFVDIGCGKGRACILAAASRRYDRVVGVELSEELVEIARQNVARFGGIRPIELICEDATRYHIPTEQSLVFLNNPFDASLLRTFIDHNIERFVQARSLIGYSHDYYRETILRSRFEVLFRDQTLNLSLYRAVR